MTSTIGEQLDGADADVFDCWPRWNQREHPHPFNDCKRIAEQFETEQEQARDFLLPQHKSLGAERDDPGALSIYERHRIIERSVADFLYYEVATYAEACGLDLVGGRIRRIALKMYQCRTSGRFGIGTHGKPVIAWDSKCAHAKLCPDESRHDAQRLFDQYSSAILDEVRKGRRIYKIWPTLPNYPRGRLREGKRHISKRYRDKIVRARHRGKNTFGHVGSLTIGEDPLSANRDWNVHLNVILIASSRLDYWKLREAWGCNIELREHKLFTEPGMHDLFNEMVKYPVQPVPTKSIEKKRTQAPAFTDWTPAEALEWYQANVGFRRVRSYGSLFGIGKPDRPQVRPLHWLGELRWQPSGYALTWHKHNFAHIVRDLLRWNPRLDLIRGDNSTARRGYKQAPGPP